MEVTIIFSIAALIMSVVIHEVAHGAVAGLLGDPTARLAGRLTLNPLKHLDPIGSVVVPAIMALLPGGLIFGWAKPVPYNPFNLRAGQWGPALVAAAGPASNLLLAIFFGLVLRFGLPAGLISPAASELVILIVFVNLVLMLFNLIPVPPLDGSKILFACLPYRFRFIEEQFSRYSLVLLLVVIFAAGGLILPVTTFLFSLITGFSF
jgi:Zn-dependent protease